MPLELYHNEYVRIGGANPVIDTKAVVHDLLVPFDIGGMTQGQSKRFFSGDCIWTMDTPVLDGEEGFCDHWETITYIKGNDNTHVIQLDAERLPPL